MVIFDLDQTLIDSRIAESKRRARKWGDVYRLIPSFSVYEGICPLIEDLQHNDIPIAVVTSSPRTYCERVITHWSLEIPICVGYHDTTFRKPHPDPINRAMEIAGMDPDQVVHIGDLARDTIAAKAAGVAAIGALWGAVDADSLIRSNPQCCFGTVADLHEYLAQQFFRQGTH